MGNTIYPKIKGTEGAEAVSLPLDSIETTTLQGVPQLSTLTARCDECGTSDIISSKPDVKTYAFLCRSCDRMNPVRYFIFDYFTTQCFN